MSLTLVSNSPADHDTENQALEQVENMMAPLRRLSWMSATQRERVVMRHQPDIDEACLEIIEEAVGLRRALIGG